MKATAVTFSIEVLIDLDSLAPDIRAKMEIEPEFSFLQGNPSILAGYLERVASELRGSEAPDEEEVSG